jgi:hypothetical protein
MVFGGLPGQGGPTAGLGRSLVWIGGVPGAARGLLSKRPQDEVKREAAAQNISWGTLKRASEGGEVIKRKDGFGAGARSFWGLS